MQSPYDSLIRWHRVIIVMQSGIVLMFAALIFLGPPLWLYAWNGAFLIMNLGFLRASLLTLAGLHCKREADRVVHAMLTRQEFVPLPQGLVLTAGSVFTANTAAQLQPLQPFLRSLPVTFLDTDDPQG